MTTPSQKTQDEPEPTQGKPQGKRKLSQGSSILERLRAGEEVPGYRINSKQRLERIDSDPKLQASRLEDAEFDRLKTMRYVLANPAKLDKTAGEKACRQWLEKSPGPFMEALDRLEEQARKNAAVEKEVDEDEEVEVTESDEELDEAIRELLQRHRRK